MELLLQISGLLDRSVKINRVVVDWDCAYLYQIWHDPNDYTYFKVSGCLCSTCGVYQFHAYYNHGGAIRGGEDAELAFAALMEAWMKKTVCEKAPIYKIPGVVIGETINGIKTMFIPADSVCDREGFVQLTMDDLVVHAGKILAYEGTEKMLCSRRGSHPLRISWKYPCCLRTL